ncbi:GNAT family N-acetyltransferase [Plantactinospora sp. KLBMP9567]|uniref:GNAT family N-acetyltransferase n=1 Tax=Plantactinospora sp. KLBMP9567 TaxID=3085900 RepID=UPI0029814A5F|nr:GNAT family N-acetyltransferase [Plantactinospora sp. KLBMP9567]MDW5325388.1 GNAT family N-acetyltransferase [Plantactinospora sp. KLBMP9567]
MDIVVTALEVADVAATERAYEIESAARSADQPDMPRLPRQRFFAGLRRPWPGDDNRHALGYLDGVAVGYLTVSLPQRENLENAGLVLAVHPEYRRRGVGRALYEYAVRVARDEGRKRIIGEVANMSPEAAPTMPGDAFAAAMGAKPALADVRRRLDLTTLDEPALDRLLTEGLARAEGYSIVRWQGATPDEYAEDVAYLDSRLVGDAPIGDLTWEAARPEVARLREMEQTHHERGQYWYNSGARHDATGRLVAWTGIGMSAGCDWHAFQQITLVEPAHRGHRLGTVIKVDNLRHIRAYEPALRFIDTFNAASNDYMISINEALGFRAVAGLNTWQAPL